MIIPIALAKEYPLVRYKSVDYLTGAKNTASDALKLFKELVSLKNSPTVSKSLISQKELELKRIIDHSDYSVLTTIAFPDAKLENYSNFNNIKDQISDPILVRGIIAFNHINYMASRGIDYYFIETGYFGNYSCEGNPNARKLWHRIVKNSMQQEKILNVPNDRWNVLCKYDTRLKWNGWKKTGRDILLVVPSDKTCKYFGINKQEWTTTVISNIKQHTDRNIIIREKTSRTDRTRKHTIYDAMNNNIYAVVSYNSIAASEAVAYGIPAFALENTSAKRVSLSDISKIETPYYPDEELVYKWCCSLAYSQFHIDEIISGDAWRMTLDNEQRDTI